MQRRTFLFQSGLLVPAVVLSPSSVWASSKAVKANILFIKGATDGADTVAGIVDEAADTVQQVTMADIAELRYSRDGFSVRLKNGSIFTTEKIVVHSGYTIDMQQLEVTVTADDDELSVAYNSGRNKQKPRPEFWSYNAGKLSKEQMQSFVKRKKHAFMCIS
jgi:hypothetical protein